MASPTEALPTADDVAHAERLVDLAWQALEAATPESAMAIRSHAGTIAQSGRHFPVITTVLHMCRAAAVAWEGEGHGRFNVAQALPTQPVTRLSLLQAVVDGDTDDDGHLHHRVEAACGASETAADELLAVSAGVHAILMAGPHRFAAKVPQSQPLDPRKLPDIRAKLVAAQSTKDAVNRLALALFEGNGTFVPCVNSADDAARVILAQERDRLTKAKLYFVDDEMTEAAIRKAVRGRKQPLAPHRVPARRGFMAFGVPLVRTVPDGVQPDPDVVAVSWGPWTADYAHAPQHIQPARAPEDAPAQPYWQWTGPEGPRYIVPFGDSGKKSWWFTFWCRPSRATPGTPLLLADNEATIGQAETLEPMHPATSDEITHIVIAAWDFITQGQVTTRPITEQEVRRRKPADLRRDRRKGVEDDSAVYLVTLRGRRPRSESSEVSESVPTGRKLEYRQEIAEYDRSHCTNPHLHRDDPDQLLHLHEEITVTDYVRGPAGAPLRPSKASRTVHQLKRTT